MSAYTIVTSAAMSITIGATLILTSLLSLALSVLRVLGYTITIGEREH